MRRGFTLLELMVAVSMLTIVGATFLGVARTVHREDRHSAAYAQDLAGLRRAVQLVERDLREAQSLEDLDMRLDDGVLYRGEKAIAHRIGTFDVDVKREQSQLAHVRIGLAPRSDAPNRRDATLDLFVRMRGSGGAK